MVSGIGEGVLDRAARGTSAVLEQRAQEVLGAELVGVDRERVVARGGEQRAPVRRERADGGIDRESGAHAAAILAPPRTRADLRSGGIDLAGCPPATYGGSAARKAAARSEKFKKASKLAQAGENSSASPARMRS
jgi:hypothetical protein